MKRKLLLIFLLLNSCAHQSRTEKYPFLVDPNNLLEQVDKFIGWTTFDNTFKCGTEINYELNRCAMKFEPYNEEQICEQKNKKAKIKIGNCTKDSKDFMDGKETWIRVRKNRYHDYNFFRAWIGAPVTGLTEKTGEAILKNYIELLKVENERFTFKNGKSIPVIRIHVIYNYFNNHTERFNSSYQSIVLGKGSETSGALLEHKIHENKLLLSRVTEIRFAK